MLSRRTFLAGSALLVAGCVPMTLARRLLGASGSGGVFMNPVSVVRGIVGDITTSTAYRYQVTDDVGSTMDTIDVCDDGAGAYLAVYHVFASGVNFNCYLATSTDLMNWTRYRLLYTNGDIPQIARRSDGSFVVGLEDEGTPHRIRIFRYATLATLLSGAYSDTILIPQTLASGGGAEGTPNFYSAEEPMDIGFHYNDGTRDKLGRGTLTGFSGWSSAADSGPDNALAAAGVNARGESTAVTYLGMTLRFIEGQYTVGDFGSFRIWYWNGSAAVLQPITTHGGSTAQANITTTIVANPSGPGQVLFVGLYLHGAGAAPGEAGPAIWYRGI